MKTKITLAALAVATIFSSAALATIVPKATGTFSGTGIKEHLVPVVVTQTTGAGNLNSTISLSTEIADCYEKSKSLVISMKKVNDLDTVVKFTCTIPSPKKVAVAPAKAPVATSAPVKAPVASQAPARRSNTMYVGGIANQVGPDLVQTQYVQAPQFVVVQPTQVAPGPAVVVDVNVGRRNR